MTQPLTLSHMTPELACRVSLVEELECQGHEAECLGKRMKSTMLELTAAVACQGCSRQPGTKTPAPAAAAPPAGRPSESLQMASLAARQVDDLTGHAGQERGLY